jgi:hypothetical protein
MGLARYALVFGLGFAAGHPTGREKLRTLPGQVATLAKRPEAQQLRDKGKAAAEQAVETAKGRLGNRSTTDGAPSTGTGGTAETPTRTGWRPLGRRRGPVIAGETTVPAGTGKAPGSTLTDDPEAATHGTLPPSSPGKSPR